ncbi:hypothetical protein FKR81_23155 [Lentzea tibetensis]|uniref:Uncharacterized protein n=1 Tax=Lentzea tibetensis TaxID=2591470 RepID=A0A563EQ14_9PSEU|nr:DUF6069 family protein [Lentzea tibetensis]TWP49455.1 hypothetical protein FKR81_23155 [Lentzea tibetensis]
MAEYQRAQTPSAPRAVDAGRLWAGGAATALVAALIAVAGILIARGLFDVPILAPKGSGAWGDASTAWYAFGAATAALAATGLVHVLLISTPRPMRFFSWAIALATIIAVLAPFASGETVAAKLATACLNLVLGAAIGSLTAGSAKSATRLARSR